MSSLSSTPAAHRRERLYWLVAALVIVVLMIGRLWWMPAMASLNVNEGWNAGHAMRAFGPGDLYPHPESLIGNNYPPLSFVIVGALGQVIGDNVIAGRILAVLAQIATGVAACGIVARLTTDRHWSIVAALVFGAFSVTLLRNYIAINDPQWLGHAAMTWGLFCLVPRRPAGVSGTRAIILAALLMVIGGLIKHNLVAFPVAASLWLVLVDRRALGIWLAALAVFAAIACGGLLAIWGPTVFVDVLMPARSYSPMRMLAKGGPLLLVMVPIVIACRPLLADWTADKRLALPLLLLGVSVPIGIIQRSGSGVDVNAFFESVIAIAILVPIAVARHDRPYRWLGVCVLPALCLVPIAAAQNIREMTGRDAAAAHASALITRITAANGPVACDDQALCYWAGRESAIDFFSVKQRLLHGKARALGPALAQGRFAMIEMRSENRGWQENLLIPAIRAHYVTVYAADGDELLVPRPGKAPPAR